MDWLGYYNRTGPVKFPLGSVGQWNTNDIDQTYPDQYLIPTPTVFDDGQWRKIEVTYESRGVTVTVSGRLERSRVRMGEMVLLLSSCQMP